MRAPTSAGLLLSLVASTSAVQYGYNHVTVRRDSKIVEGAFGDVDIDLRSPAFLHPEGRQPGFSNGTQGPSSQEAMEGFMKKLAASNDFMTYNMAEFRSEEGRSYPHIRLTAGEGKSTNDKLRVWIQGAVHGNEPGGDEAVQALLGKFDYDQDWASHILEKVELLVLPRYNPDGVFYFQRTLATNFDPNRDHVKLARQQTRDIKKMLNDFKPHVVVDMHEYSASSTFGDGQYKHGSDGLFSAAKNLNIHKDIREMSENLFAKNIAGDMKAAGLRSEPYVTGSTSFSPDYVANFAEAGTDAKIGRNAMGLTQAITFLVETRGISLADQEFQRRTAAGFTMLSSIVQTAADNADDVFKTVEGGIKKFIESGDDVVVTDYSNADIRPFSMVNVNNGSAMTPPVRFASTTPAIANLTRPRPEAYLIPVAWADLADRLRVSGLEVEEMKEPWTGTVETLTFTSARVDAAYYEGVVRVTTTAEASQRQITLPAGSFRVSTRQKNAGLAIVALEPENIDSYVTFNIVPVEVEDEYPIFRVM